MNYLSNDFNREKYKQYILQKYISDFLDGIYDTNELRITNAIKEQIMLPNFGDHVVTKRSLYTHHGIYIGDKKVIQYSGYAIGFNLLDTAPNITDKRSPVEVVSWNDFTQGKNYWVEKHNDSKYTKEEIVSRAFSRIDEREYNLFFNNCEHFVNWCIYNHVSSRQWRKILRFIFPIKTEAYHIGKALLSYTNGNINEEKLKNELLCSFKDLDEFYNNSIIVKESKRRRDKAEEICEFVIPMLEEIRMELKDYMDKYFLERSLILNKSFNKILSNNYDEIREGLDEINSLYGKKSNYLTVDNIKSILLNKK